MNLEQHPAGIIRKAAERRRLNGLVPEGFVEAEPLEHVEPEPEPPPRKGRGRPAWAGKLIRGDKGPKAIEANVALALRMDPAFVGRIRFNELAEAVECSGLPWRACASWRSWTDTDDIALAVWMQHRDVAVKPATCAAAVQLVAADHPCHPVRDYLDRCAAKWDGTKRLDGLFPTYFGARPEPGREEYLRQVGRKWMIAAAARVYRPGCKVDTVPTIEGRQGERKSSALAALVPDPAWFGDEISELGTKDSAQDLRGKWIIEIPELSAMKRAEVERIKAFISRRIDHYRPSYGRRSQDFPRGCVFAATTNEDAYLQDATGNRRFWPLKAGTIDLDGLCRDRDQLWGEAVAAFRAGEAWWLDRELEAAAAEEQDARRIADPWEAPLLDWADAQTGPVGVQAALAALNVPTERHDQAAANRVARIFKAAGWDRFQRREAGARVWLYRRPSPVSPDDSCPTGDGKVSNGAAVTSVTSSSEIKTSVPAHGCTERPVTGGDTGDTPRQPCRQDPGDERHWLGKLRVARVHEHRDLVIRDWTEATGGKAGIRGEVLVAEVPRAFLNCTIANLARRYGWDVRGMGR